MKFIQLGILAALILVAGLLALNLMQDRKAGMDPAPIPAVAAERNGEAMAEPATAETLTGDAVTVEEEEAGSAPSVTPEKPAPAPPVRAAGAAKPSSTTPVITPAKPEPKDARKETTVAARNQVPTPPAAPAPIVVDPPQSTNEAWSAPSEPVPAQTKQNRYELMRPERQDPAPAAEPAPAVAAAAEPPRTVTLPAGTILTIRTTQLLSSESATVDDTFLGTLDQPLVHEDLVIAERGSKVEGRVVQVVDSGRVKGTAALAVQLTRINTSDGQTVPVQTQTFTMNAEKSTKSDAAKVGIATGIGAALGAIFGGGKGAAIGAGVGAGAGAGTVLGSKGKPAEIPSETRLNFRLDAPLVLTEKINP